MTLVSLLQDVTWTTPKLGLRTDILATGDDPPVGHVIGPYCFDEVTSTLDPERVGKVLKVIRPPAAA
jgi:hypothetical protein